MDVLITPLFSKYPDKVKLNTLEGDLSPDTVLEELYKRLPAAEANILRGMNEGLKMLPGIQFSRVDARSPSGRVSQSFYLPPGRSVKAPETLAVEGENGRGYILTNGILLQQMGEVSALLRVMGGDLWPIEGTSSVFLDPSLPAQCCVAVPIDCPLLPIVGIEGFDLFVHRKETFGKSVVT